MDLFCTSCSREKRRRPEPLPAIERYTSPRIRALARRARRLGSPMAILSGEFGLLDPETLIPWYDHALAAGEVAELAPRVARQLGEWQPRRVVFFARPAETRGWLPYHEVLGQACAQLGVELRIEDAESELCGAAPELADRLFDLVEGDERTRARLAASGKLFDGYASEMETVHRDNAAGLESILDRHGWPGRTLVGAEGALAAWTIAQHAISLPDFQRRCRRLLERAVAGKEAESCHHAHLVDRIRFNERRPQVYGTIFDWDEKGRLSPWPIERAEEVEERRAAVGLPRLEPVIAENRRRAEAEGERPPASFAARQREIEQWCRGVGWLPSHGA